MRVGPCPVGGEIAAAAPRADGRAGVILTVQYLRAAAALMVVAFHAGTQVARLGATPPSWLAAGRFGVDVFFVISGVVMWVTTRDRALGPGAFMARRLLRIVPLYWAVTLAVAGAALFTPRLLSSTTFDLPHLLASLLFVPWPHPVQPGFAPVIIPGWTLNCEMMFYGLFALCLGVPRARRAAAIVLTLGALVAGARLLPSGGILGFYGDPIVLEFGAGVLLGTAFTARRRPVRVEAAASLAAAGLGALLLVGSEALPGQPHVLAAGVPASLVVGGLLLFERARPVPLWPVLARIGDASYAIYLTHVLVLPAVTLAWRSAGLAIGGWSTGAFWGASLLVSTLAGLAAHRWLEVPLTDAVRRRLSRDSRPQPA